MTDSGFIFKFVAAGSGPPEAMRIKKLLKSALRSHQCRALLVGRDEEALLTVAAEIIDSPVGLKLKRTQTKTNQDGCTDLSEATDKHTDKDFTNTVNSPAKLQSAMDEASIVAKTTHGTTGTHTPPRARPAVDSTTNSVARICKL